MAKPNRTKASATTRPVTAQPTAKAPAAPLPPVAPPPAPPTQAAAPAKAKAIPTDKRDVKIQLTNPEAREVFIAGNFNAWDPQANPLKKSPSGHWEAHLSLSPGTYEYRFVADGAWIEDPAATESANNPFGESNSVLRVR